MNSFPLPDGRTALVVGDVVGHGLGAAATMGQLSMEARALLSAGLAPDEVLEHLDETVTLLDDAESGWRPVTARSGRPAASPSTTPSATG